MILPDHIVSKIADPAERRRHGPTWSEAVTRDYHKLERRLHSDFSGFLKRHEHELLVRHTNPTKKTTDGAGWPDYQIFGRDGRSLWIEFKVGSNKPTPEQETKIAQLRAFGHEVLVLRDYESAVRAVINYFKL